MKIQILDTSYGYSKDKLPVVQLYGLTEKGQPIIKYVNNFLPYMFVRSNNLEDLKGYFTGLGKSIGIKTFFETVERFLPIGYQSKPTKMLKVITHNPKDIAILRDFAAAEGYVTYESDIFFKNRFLIDHDLGGMAWAVVPEKQFIDHEDVIAVLDNLNAPMKIMAIDIECLPKGDSMPTADSEPIIMISLAFDPPWRGQETVVLVAQPLNCPREDVIPASSEIQMLNKLSFITEEYDPDILGGFNSNGFDIPYITQRSQVLGVSLRLSRDGRSPWVKSFMGKNTVSITGRVVLDMLPILRSMDKYRLKSYRLENVAKEVLKEEKYNVRPGEMKELWEGPGLPRFISYSRHDAWLVMKLIKDLKILDRYIALAKASGALLQDVVDGGQSNMIEALLMRKFRAANRVVGIKPSIVEDDTPEVKGAFVLDPEVGLSENVAILDFKSLYPTIMIAYNLCFTTEIVEEQPACTPIVSPSGGKFVPPEILKGLVPQIQENLLAERMKVKKLMKDATDAERDILDAKQYALKILLNSIYGYSGYMRARLFSPVIANSVTSYGRENLLKTREIVKNNNMEVIAADTDSVFITFPEISDFESAKKIGIKIASIVNSGLPKPMELVFEAYAKRILIVSKKHYAMYKFEKPNEGKIKTKGIETVRRDWCDLTADTLNRCLDIILREGDVEDALEYARETLIRLKNPDHNIMQKLILTRTLTRNPENYKQKQPHAEMVKRLEERGIHKYVLGDRVPFIIVKGRRKSLMVDRSEDPEYALEHKLRIDDEYYIQKQLLPPLSRIFGSFGISEMDLMQNSRQQTLFSW